MPVHNFRRPQGRLVEIEIRSSALEGNLLGDPAQRVVAVYLPPGYDDGDRRYPLFVDLVGFTGSGLSHVGWKAFGESVPQRLDRLVAEGRMGPVVAAFPDCFTSLGGNQYIDSAAPGPGAAFPLGGSPRRRGPGAWGAGPCHSGDMAFDLCYRVDFPKTLGFLAEKGGVGGFFEAFAAAPKADDEWLHRLEVLAMAATYDPDPLAPMGVRLPLDPETAEIDPARWAAWLAHDPVVLVGRADCQANLRSLRGLYLDCGGKDQYHLVYGARAFARALRAAGIAHRYEEFDDDHTNVDYRMDVSLPFLYEALMGDGGS